jgi:ABC-2 type transport system permease protein
VQCLIWIGVIDLILASIVWRPETSVEESVMLYSIFTGLGPAIAIIIIMQDAVVGEKEAGTAAWILSKPASRAAFILSKLVANIVGVLATMILAPGVIAYVQIGLAKGEWLNPLLFLGGMAIFLVYIVYYLALTLMLGTLFNHRGPVIGIAMALAFGQQMVFGLLPSLSKVLPWVLTIPVNNLFDRSLAAATMLGETPPTLLPLYITLISIVIFVAVSLWKFEKEEL